MGEVRTPFSIVDFLTKPPLSFNPRVSDDVQQTLATLVGFEGTGRRILRCTKTGMLQTVNPTAQKFINTTVGTPTYKYQGPDIKCSEVVVRAHPENSGRVWVNIYALADVDIGWPLDANEHITLTLTTLQHLHLDSFNSDEKVIIFYTQ